MEKNIGEKYVRADITVISLLATDVITTSGDSDSDIQDNLSGDTWH